MTVAIVESLMALTDVRGVEGSFFATRDGSVIARAMPRYFDDEALSQAAPRLGRILEALDDLGGGVEAALARHPNHAVLLRPAGEGILCVIATSEVNVPSLKRATALVARKIGHLAIDPAPATSSGAPPARATGSGAPPTAPPPRSMVPGAPATPAMRWRGAKV